MFAGHRTGSRGRGVGLAHSRRFTLKAPPSPGKARAGSALRASPVARLEASPDVARARQTHSRPAAVRSTATTTLTIATTRTTWLTSSSSAALRPDAPSPTATAAANSAAEAKYETFKCIEPIEELTSAASAAAMAASRHGGAARRRTALGGVVGLEEACGGAEPQDDTRRRPLPTEAAVARGFARALRRRAGTDVRANGPRGILPAERRPEGRRGNGGPPTR